MDGFFQNLGKEAVPTFMHTTVYIEKKIIYYLGYVTKYGEM